MEGVDLPQVNAWGRSRMLRLERQKSGIEPEIRQEDQKDEFDLRILINNSEIPSGQTHIRALERV
jgi:hypothetical protein